MRLIAGDRQATKAWCRERRDVYADRLGLAKAPRIVWSRDAWNALVPRDENSAVNGDKAEISFTVGVMFMDLNAQICRHDADDTIAHELVHLRWPSLSHGLRFTSLVNAVRRGVRFGPHGSRLPALA